MKIGFYLTRDTQIKTLGNLIAESVGRGHETTVFFEENSLQGGDKAYQNLSAEKVNTFSQLGAKIQKVVGLADLLSKPDVEVLIAHKPFYTFQNQMLELANLREQGVRVVSITHFFEVVVEPLSSFNHFDLAVYPSQFARELHVDIQRKYGEPGDANTDSGHYFIGGAPMFDQITHGSREQARKELGIAADAKVVLLMAPVISPITPWRFHVWREASRLEKTRVALLVGKMNFLPDIWLTPAWGDIFKTIKLFCTDNSAMLITKSRGKQADLDYMVAGSDLYVDGKHDEYFPLFTTYKLMAAADLCITVNSTAVVEAVAAGVPCLNIHVPHLDFAEPLTKAYTRYMDVLMGPQPGSLVNFPGCVWHVEHAKIISWLRGRNLESITIEPEAQATYTRELLGITERSSSERIMDKVEAE